MNLNIVRRVQWKWIVAFQCQSSKYVEFEKVHLVTHYLDF